RAIGCKCRPNLVGVCHACCRNPNEVSPFTVSLHFFLCQTIGQHHPISDEPVVDRFIVLFPGSPVVSSFSWFHFNKVIAGERQCPCGRIWPKRGNEVARQPITRLAHIKRRSAAFGGGHRRSRL